MALFNGGAGHDTLAGGADKDVVNGLGGNDHLSGAASNDTVDGGAGNDQLFGGDDNDALFGAAGNDTLDGGANDDAMTGGAGNDVYILTEAGDSASEAPGGGIDTIQTSLDNRSLADFKNVENLTLLGVADLVASGSDLANVLTGNDGLNLLSGGKGNDTLDGGAGADTLKGGAGNDVYLVDSFFDEVEEAVGGGKDTIRSTGTYQLLDGQEIETLIITSGGAGFGNNLANAITMLGGGGATFDGGAGNDTLTGSTGSDLLSGDADNDLLIGGDGSDRLFGDEGNDTMNGGKGNDTYAVDSVADKVNELANQGTDVVFSQLASYTLTANVEDLRLNDKLGLNGTGNALNNTLTGNALGNQLDGAGGNDSLDGGEGGDTLIGGLGNDTLNGGFAADKMTGGAGNDLYVWDDAGDTIVELAGGGVDTVQTDRNGHILAANVENLTLTGVAHISGTGNGQANALTGNDGKNVLAGEGGNDTLDGGAGDDTLKGGAGNDVYLVDSFFDVIEEAVGGGKDTVRSTGTYDLADDQEIENLIITATGSVGGFGNGLANAITMLGGGDATFNGGAGNDTLIGSTNSDLLTGDEDNDVLNGGDGADRLFGEEGNDTMNGGDGADLYSVDSAGDKVSESVGKGTDIVFSSLASYTLTANVENLRMNDGLGLNGTGNALNNTLTGNALANVLDGAAGNDSLSGVEGADTLKGGVGNDTLDGGIGGDRMEGGAGNDLYVWDDAGDTAVELAGGGIDTVRTDRNGHILAANVENLTLLGVAHITGTGNGLANYLTGNGGKNVLTGDAGHDTLDGGGDNDTLKGGTGNDVYIVDSIDDVVEEAIGAGKDTIRALVAYNLVDDQEVENLILLAGGIGFGGGNKFANVITMEGAGQVLMFGHEGNDTLNGGAGNDELYGDEDNDVLNGGAGNDILQFGTGNDAMSGGKGDDQYHVESAGDKVTELAGQGIDTVHSYVADYTLGANVENLELDAGLNGIGNALNNRIIGNLFVNKLDGAGGNDFLAGGSGADTLLGGAGNDELLGEVSADTLNGGVGNDILEGGRSADVMSGEAGADVFRYAIAVEADLEFLGGDTINGFKSGVDKIDLSDLFADFAIDPDDAFFGGYLFLDKMGSDTFIRFNQDGSVGPEPSVTLAQVTGAMVLARDLILET